MKDETKIVIALVLAAVSLLYPRIEAWVKNIKVPGVNSSIVNVDFEPVVEPSAEMQAFAKGVGDSIQGQDADYDKVRIAQFYAQLSHVVRNEPGFITSTSQFRSYYMIAGQINFAGKSLKGKYPTLNTSVDAAITKAIGLDNKQLDSETRTRLANILAAISWEIWHGYN